MQNRKYIKEIADCFALGEIIGEPKILTGGDVNKNMKIVTSTGEYVVKIIDINSLTQSYQINTDLLLFSLKFSENIAAYMQKNGIPTVTALNHEQQKIFIKNNFLFIVYPYFPGQAHSVNAISISQLKKIAAILAKMHSLNIHDFQHEQALLKWSKMIEIFLRMMEQKPWKLIKQLKISDAIKTDAKYLEDFFDKIASTLSTTLASTKHLLLTHNDLKPKNVLWSTENIPMIIDWEAAGYMPQDVDYIDTILAWCVNSQGKDYLFDLGRLESFTSEYKIFCKAPIVTNQTIDIVIMKWIFWFAFCINKLIVQDTVEEYTNFSIEALKYLKFIKEHRELLIKLA